eukprot:jgi/Pico_ML_1/50692/g1857.t2
MSDEDVNPVDGGGMDVRFRDAAGGEDVGPCAFRDEEKVERLKEKLVEELGAKRGEKCVAPKKEELKLILAGRVLEDGQTVRGEPETSNESDAEAMIRAMNEPVD